MILASLYPLMYIHDRKLSGAPDRAVRRCLERGRSDRTYELAQERLGECLIDLQSLATEQERFERIRRAMECELNLRFAPTDPRLIERRERLRGLFRSVPPTRASKLQRELEEAQSALAKLFWRRLAPATSKEMLGILCQRFFKEYELRFNPLADTFFVDKNPTMTTSDRFLRKRDVNDLIGDVSNKPGILWRRLQVRADAALDNGAVPPSLPAPDPPLKDAVQRISDAQVNLFRESFPDGQGGIDFRAFQRCFERFANGELRDPSVPGHVGFGEPNGGNYFLFAEFGFLCIELKFKESIWAEALRTFVKTQEIFMHVYRERATSPPPPVNAPVPVPGQERRDIVPPQKANDPGFDFSFFKAIGRSVTVGKGQSDFQRKVALRSKYDAMGVSALKAAARDNLLRALRMP